MRKYESLYILRPDLDEEATKALVERFSNVVTEQGGEVTNLDEWGKRKLAYPIKKHREGYYVLMNFNAEADVPRELERIFKITDGVLRYIVIREDK